MAGEKNKCRCETDSYMEIVSNVIGYERSLYVTLNFEAKNIKVHYDHTCDRGTYRTLNINFCPLCGKKL